MPLGEYVDSGLRHVAKLMLGSKEEDHAAAVIWNFCCMLETAMMIEEGILSEDLDDIGYCDRGT